MRRNQQNKHNRVQRRAREEEARQRPEAERNALLAKVHTMEVEGTPLSLGMFFVLSYCWVTCYRGNIALVACAITHGDSGVTKILGNTPTITHVLTL